MIAEGMKGFILPANPCSVLSHCAVFIFEDSVDKWKPVIEEGFALFQLFELIKPVPYPEMGSCMFIMDRKALSIRLEENAHGQATHCMFVDFLRKDRNPESNTKRLLVLFEEMCHCLYLIQDEWEVKEVVVEILQLKYPHLRLHKLYPGMFDQNGNRIFPDGQRRYDFYQPPQAVGKTRSEESHS